METVGTKKEGDLPRPKKNHTTLAPTVTTKESVEAPAHVKQAFHEQRREVMRGAIRVVLEAMIREALGTLLQADWGENTAAWQGYRHGSDARDVVTPSGRMEKVHGARDRAGPFHTHAFERSSRSEPQAAEALTERCVSGTSTHTIGQMAQTQVGETPSAWTVSRLTQTFTE
jgi:transposase-like protein